MYQQIKSFPIVCTNKECCQILDKEANDWLKDQNGTIEVVGDQLSFSEVDQKGIYIIRYIAQKEIVAGKPRTDEKD